MHWIELVTLLKEGWGKQVHIQIFYQMHPIQILVEFLPESWQSLFWLETEESTAGSSLKLQKMVSI